MTVDRRDVMVGVLHTAQQLEANLEHNFYHMPAPLLAADPKQVQYIALYQSHRLFGRSRGGICHYGRVKERQQLRRGEITEIPTRNPGELYWRFCIEKWRRLKPPIQAIGIAPGVRLFTSLYLLKNSRIYPELLLQTREEHRLCCRLRAACRRTLQSGQVESLPAIDGYTVLVMGWTVGIYTPSGEYRQRDLREFNTAPHDFLQRIQPYIVLEENP